MLLHNQVTGFSYDTIKKIGFCFCWGLRLNLREIGIVEEEVVEEGKGTPVTAVGEIGTGGYGGFEGGSDGAQRVCQKIVLWAHHC